MNRYPFRVQATHAPLPHRAVSYHFLKLCAAALLALAAVLHLATLSFAQTSINPDAPYISEVSPTAGTGAPAWVEITMGRTTSGSVEQPAGLAFLPLVNGSEDQQAIAAQIFPDAGSNLHGWHLSDMDGNVYDVPINLPFLAKGIVVVVRFDGQGAAANDMDPSDGRIVLHTPAGMTDIFDDAGDQLALTDPSGTLISFVAWGQPAADDDDAAVTAGMWTPDAHVIYDGGFGAGQVNVPPTPNASLGIWQNQPTVDPTNWVAYAPGNSTPGALNPPPAPLQSTMPNGALVVINGPTADEILPADAASTQGVTLLPANQIAIAWSGMGADFDYHFQLAPASDFATPVVNDTFPNPGWAGELQEGTWFWRTRIQDAQGNFSQYLGPYQIVVFDAFDLTSLGTIKMLLDADEYKLQHKDSNMLDIGGGTNNIVGNSNAGNRRYPADRRWDGEHVDANGVPSFGWNGMDNWYCVRASTAMINDFYGGNLTQDRLS